MTGFCAAQRLPSVLITGAGSGCGKTTVGRLLAQRLGRELEKLFEQTILAMRECEAAVNREMEQLGLA